jgi:hypothetical protein
MLFSCTIRGRIYIKKMSRGEKKEKEKKHNDNNVKWLSIIFY